MFDMVLNTLLKSFVSFFEKRVKIKIPCFTLAVEGFASRENWKHFIKFIF